MEGIVKVKCRFIKTRYSTLFKCPPIREFNCFNIWYNNYCEAIISVTWTEYIIYRKYLIEVKDVS